METTNNDITGRELRMTATLPAPVDKVWTVWTNPEHIAQWWGPNGFTNDIHTMDLLPGGEWRLTMKGPDGQTFPNRSVFLEIVPQSTIAFQHFNPAFITTVTFTPKGNETFLEWAMLFETAELFETVVKVFKADDGLKQNIEKLTAYLEANEHR